mgnify:CR=1 FL=1
MSIITISPRTDPRWQCLVDQTKSDVFHSVEWMNVLAETYGFQIQALVGLDDQNAARAGIAYCTIEDMMDPRIVSLPFSDFCDPMVGNRDEWNCLISRLLDQGQRISLRCLHNQVPLDDPRFTKVGRAKWHCVDLRRDEAEIWNGLHGSARRAIRKAKRNGITVRAAQNKDDLRAFFNLHLRARKYKYKMPAQPYRFFENIWEQFIVPGKGALLLATHEDEVIGGVLFLAWQKTLYYKFNASNSDMITLRPNDLVVWEGIKFGQANGLDFLDFGLSDWDQEGLLQYKRKFATEEKTISLLRYMPESSPSDTEKQIRGLLPQLTDLFVDDSVPDGITEKAGDSLYQFFT